MMTLTKLDHSLADVAVHMIEIIRGGFEQSYILSSVEGVIAKLREVSSGAPAPPAIYKRST